MTLLIEASVGCEGVVPGLRQPLWGLRRIANPKSARQWLGFSLRQMGEELGRVHPNGHTGRAYTKGAVSRFESGDYRVTEDTRRAYALLVAEAISQATNGMVNVRARFGRRWKFEPVSNCLSCGRPIILRRKRQRFCARCRAK